jgi:steroid 5-alpha reductase family enzyme
MNKAFLLCVLSYVLSLFAAVISSSFFMDGHLWKAITIGHIVATLIIYLASVLAKNSSFYDPFWSIAPLPIIIYLSFISYERDKNLLKVLVILIPVIYWSLRLTNNWRRSWKGLSHEDFRYIDLKTRFKKFPYLIDFFGIHLYPTLQVNFSLFPLYYYFLSDFSPVPIALYIFSFFTIGAVFLEHLADEQMREFRSQPENKGKTMNRSLWKYSRHPNYLGEVLFWWGLYLMTLSVNLNFWWLFICPLSMTLMFTLVTCSMMDNRSLLNRPDYSTYMAKTSQLLLWWPKS